jgi:hypothetical protein
MSFGNPTHHHGKRHQGWDSSDDYQVYESTTMVEAARPARVTDIGPRYSYGVEYNNDYEERVVEAPRVRVKEHHEFATQHVKPGHHHVHDENVDKEAGEFIKLEHKKFEQRKLMPMRSF